MTSSVVTSTASFLNDLPFPQNHCQERRSWENSSLESKYEIIDHFKSDTPNSYVFLFFLMKKNKKNLFVK